MRVYNLYGRRDNKFKARIKILVHELGADEFKRQVEVEYAKRSYTGIEVDARELERITAYFSAPALETLSKWSPPFEEARLKDKDFAQWVKVNVAPHRTQGYAIVNISLKPDGGIPGDATAEQMRTVADLALRFSFDELRVSHHQNLVLPHVKRDDLYTIWKILKAADLAASNIGLIGDIIACPGLDYCALATARSIPVVAGHLAPLRRLEAPGGHRSPQDQHLGLHQCLRPPSRRQHRHPRPR